MVLTYLNFTDGWFFKETVVMRLVVSGGSIWDIIAMNVKRRFQRKSFPIR
jgi:hypothetical protein